MTHEEALARVNLEGQQSHIEQIFYTVYENICAVYGGEDKIEPFHLADIRGSLTRAKVYALIPSENENGKKTPANGQPGDAGHPNTGEHWY